MTADSKFTGFSKESIKFYADLKKNNKKSWFEKNKTIYESSVMAQTRMFVSEMGKQLKQIAPNIIADPRVNKSIFKIHRDVRFSKDKTPYKTHLAVWFWEGHLPRMECSGFYFHLEPPNLMLGVGIYMFPKHVLQEFRKSVIHSIYGPQLAKLSADFSKKRKYNFGGKHYKKVPSGFDPAHKNSEFLLYNGLYAGTETKIPKELYSKDILGYCKKTYKEMLPLHKWLLALTKRV
jgi:uncharacterized protein (TIGR02453 family)